MALALALALLLIVTVERLIATTVRDLLPWYASPIVWVALPWIFCLTLFALPLIEHRETLEFKHSAYILACFGTFMLGTVLIQVSSAAPQKRKDHVKAPIPTPRLMYGSAVLGLVGYAAATYDQIAVTGLSLFARFSDEGIASARTMRNLAIAQGVNGPFSRLESLMAFAFIFLIFLLLGVKSEAWSKRNVANFKWLAAAFTIVIPIYGLAITGGRLQIAILLLVVLSTVALDKNRQLWRIYLSIGKLKRRIVIAVILVMAIGSVAWLASGFAKARAGSGSAIVNLNVAHRADVAPWLYPYVHRSPLAANAAFQVSYFTTPIATLTYYLDLPEDQFPGPFLGQYNFYGLADRVIRRFDSTLIVEWWNEIDLPLEMRGYGGNVWPTLFRDLAVDFTRWGVPPFMFFLGLTASYFTRRAYVLGEGAVVAVAVSILAVLAFSAFHSLIKIPLIWGIFQWGLLLFAFQKIYPKTAIVSNRNHPGNRVPGQ